MAGFFDIANSEFDIKAHKEDFGQTLGFYGVGGGFPLVLPLLGQSNLRDAIGRVFDSTLNPLNYMVDEKEEYFLIKTLEAINYTSLHVKEYEEIKKDAIELYPFLRDIYEQRREKLIKE